MILAKKLQIVFCTAILFLFIYFIIVVNYKLPIPSLYKLYKVSVCQPTSEDKQVSTDLNTTEWTDASSPLANKYLIRTPACTLPVSSLWPKFYKDNWDYVNHPSPDCRGRTLLATLTEDEFFLKVNESILGSNCSLYEVLKDPETDNSYLLEYRDTLNKSLVSLSGLEMVLLECDNQTFNIEATVPIKAEVERKLQYWKDTPAAEFPPSILLLGFESTSRMHAIRSLPKSMKILNELGFMDFKGYHTILPNTLANFMAMLMGLTENGTRLGCARGWRSSYDKCPLIWNNFSSRNYVTVYNEDSLGSMSYGGMGGFETTPTDYYLHPLFLALHSKEHGASEQCASTEGVPAFMLRYMERFLRKFHNKTPFFLMNYFAYPFHDLPLPLVTADKHLARFLNFLRTLPNFFSNTLVVIMGDHGDRFQFFSQDSQEAYLERSLPPLFLRIPDKLQKMYPEFQRNAQQNTGRLTTAFDIHHTFLHLLSLNDEEAASHFNPSLSDRSSLLSPIPPTRNCDTVNIAEGFCVCNATAKAKTVDDPNLLDRMVKYAMGELNGLLAGSKYKSLCKFWARSPNSTLLSAHVLEEREDGDKVLVLRFPAEPGNGLFSVKMRVDKTSALWIEGAISRANKYGDQSWCVGAETDEDKYMKQVCYCREEKPKAEQNPRNREEVQRREESERRKEAQRRANFFIMHNV